MINPNIFYQFVQTLLILPNLETGVVGDISRYMDNWQNEATCHLFLN